MQGHMQDTSLWDAIVHLVIALAGGIAGAFAIVAKSAGRLARIEAKLDDMATRQDRIEAKLDRHLEKGK